MAERKMIYLDDAINMMRQHSHYDDFERCVIDESVAMKALEDLPLAQPERKRGRWVQIQVRTAPHNRISKVLKCSVCGKRKDKYVTWNFCPNCGADMRKREGNNV